MMYLLFSFVAAVVFAQGGGNGGGNPLGSTCDEKREEPIDVFFLVDGSSSIGSHHNMTNYDPSAWPGQLRFVKKLIENTLTVEGDRVGIYQFSIKPNMSLANEPDFLGTMEYELDTPIQDIIDTVQNMEQRLGGTPTREAIGVAVQQFEQHEIQGEERQRLLVIVTDGDPTCGKYVGYEACHDPCHNMEGNPIVNTKIMLGLANVKTVVIGVNNEAEKLKCLVEDPEVNIVKISDFHSFGDYRDPTGDDNLLCVNPQELELQCCRASVFTDELKGMYDNLCRNYGYIECFHRRGTILGSCEWGIDTEGEVIDGCGVETHRPTPEPSLAPTTPEPTLAPTTPEPTLTPTTPAPTQKRCCRASVFTPELKTMYDNLCQQHSYIECVHRRGTVLGSCEWGVDTEGNDIDGCAVEEPTASPTPAPLPTTPTPESCCRASVFTEDTKTMYNNLCKQNSYIECVHRRGTILGSCEWGVDTEGNDIDGCEVEEPTTPAPAPKCCRASVFTDDTKTMYDNLCKQNSYVECVHRRGTILGSCEWGVDTEGNDIDMCEVEETTVAPTIPTVAPTRLTCVPMHNCVVKGGEKVFGWINAGGRMQADSACDCAERCEQQGGTDAKWHIKRKICKCWKQATQIILQVEPFEPNRKHGGNAGGMTECVQTLNSVADVTEEQTFTITATTRTPTAATVTIPAIPNIPPAPTSKPTMSPEECEKAHQEYLDGPFSKWDSCTWKWTECKFACA